MLRLASVSCLQTLCPRPATGHPPSCAHSQAELGLPVCGLRFLKGIIRNATRGRGAAPREKEWPKLNGCFVQVGSLPGVQTTRQPKRIRAPGSAPSSVSGLHEEPTPASRKSALHQHYRRREPGPHPLQVGACLRAPLLHGLRDDTGHRAQREARGQG